MKTSAIAFFSHPVALSRGILRIPHLNAFLPECGKVTPYWRGQGGEFDAVIGWGHKTTAAPARTLAQREGLPYLALEDGFLRSVSPGGKGDLLLSVVVDDVGIYYDATAPSRLEILLQDSGWETPELMERARGAMQRIVAGKLSKYNHAPWLDGALPGHRKQKVLVVDQTYGDSSVTCGMADGATFERMLTAAVEENPEADIVIKVHPDVVAGKKRGYLSSRTHRSSRIHVMGADLNPLSVIEKADRVYVVTSQVGFEALLLGKPVECFGMPFYAGWGLTRDRQTCPRRTRARTLLEVFAAAYILYARYIDPTTGRQGSIEQVIDHLVLQCRAHRLDAGRLSLHGISLVETSLHSKGPVRSREPGDILGQPQRVGSGRQSGGLGCRRPFGIGERS